MELIEQTIKKYDPTQCDICSDVTDLTTAEIERIFAITADLKAKFSQGLREPLLPGRVMGMLFEKPSLRTRVSFEAGMINSAAAACSSATTSASAPRKHRRFRPRAQPVRRRDRGPREPASNRGRTGAAQHLLGDQRPDRLRHPCQALADLYTLKELVGRLKGRRWPTSATATTWPAA